jgi:hypothetical protein
MVCIATSLSDTQPKANSEACHSLASRSYVRGWVQLGPMASPTILVAGAVTFLVLH